MREFWKTVVVPSLTPGSYNDSEAQRVVLDVVVPSLTPGSYNFARLTSPCASVVVPSLTPGSYNMLSHKVLNNIVVVPSLTPGSYNRPRCKPCATGLTAQFTCKKMEFLRNNLAIFFIFSKNASKWQ